MEIFDDARVESIFCSHSLHGMKRQPSVKIYWSKVPSIFHCSIISSIFTRRHFELLTKCMHVRDPSTYVSDRNMVGYDKMGQVRELDDKVRQNFQRVWNLGKFVIVDEMMVSYKGIYCLARQYMPKKPQKWSIKVWCLVDSRFRFVYDFDIYCGRNGGIFDLEAPRCCPVVNTYTM